jgi:hypothetical protein
MTINIKQLKLNFVNKYPQHQLNEVLVQTPDLLENDTFLEMTKIWLYILKR